VWVVGLVAGILLLIAVALAVPIDLSFWVERDAHFMLKARVRWMFGLIGKDVGRSRVSRGNQAGGDRSPGRNGSVRVLLAALTTSGFPQKLYSFARAGLPSLKIHELRVNFRVGLGGEAETGLLFAALAPAMVLIRSYSRADVQFQPDFEEELLEGYCKGDIRAVPIKLVWLMVPFFLSATTIRAVKAMIKARRMTESYAGAPSA